MNLNELLDLKLKHFKFVPWKILDRMKLDDNERAMAFFLKACVTSKFIDQLYADKCFGSRLGFCQLKGQMPAGTILEVKLDVCPDFNEVSSKGLIKLSLEGSMRQAIHEIKEFWFELLGQLEDKELERFGFEKFGHGIYQCKDFEVRAFKGYNKVTFGYAKSNDEVKINTWVVLTDSPTLALLNYVSTFKMGFMDLPSELRDRIIKNDFNPSFVVHEDELDDFRMQHHLSPIVHEKTFDGPTYTPICEILKRMFLKQ